MTREWMFREDGEGVPHDRDRDCADTCHPVALINPAGPEVRRLRLIMGTRFAGGMAELRGILRHLATPPKPEEPTGLGAVVEDAEGYQWVRCGSPEGHRWYRDNAWAGEGDYAQISAVRVLSEGVQP